MPRDLAAARRRFRVILTLLECLVEQRIRGVDRDVVAAQDLVDHFLPVYREFQSQAKVVVVERRGVDHHREDIVPTPREVRDHDTGRPPEENAANLSFDRMTADVNELADHLRTRSGQDRILLLGHSRGAMTGLARPSPTSDDRRMRQW